MARRGPWSLFPGLVLFVVLGCDVRGAEGRGVELFVEPEAGVERLVALLASARRSLWIEMYLLTDERALAALEERARAGCDVRVILEPAPYRDDDANLAAYDRLAAAGARVRWASDRFRYTHAKTAIIDSARLVVMTLNLTSSGLGGGNREFAILDEDPADVAAAVRVFAADEVGGLAGGGARVVTSPDGSRAVWRALIDQATSTLAIESEELTDSDVRDALDAARARGVAVTVVLPAEGAAPAMHAKAAVADGRACYVGSANLSPTSLDRNREIGLVLDDPAPCGTVASTIAADAARRPTP